MASERDVASRSCVKCGSEDINVSWHGAGAKHYTREYTEWQLTILRALRMLAVLGVTAAPQIFQTGGVVRELTLELHERHARVRRLGADGTIAVYRRHLVPLSVEPTSDEAACAT